MTNNHLTDNDYGSFELNQNQITRFLNSCGIEVDRADVQTVHVGAYIHGTVSYAINGNETGMNNSWNEIPSKWRTAIRRDAARALAL